MEKKEYTTMVRRKSYWDDIGEHIAKSDMNYLDSETQLKRNVRDLQEQLTNANIKIKNLIEENNDLRRKYYGKN